MDLFNKKALAVAKEQLRQKQARINRIDNAVGEYYGYSSMDISSLYNVAKKDVFNIISESKADKKEIEILTASISDAEKALAAYKEETRLNEEKRSAKRKAKKLKKKAKKEYKQLCEVVKPGDKFTYAGATYWCKRVKRCDYHPAIIGIVDGSIRPQAFLAVEIPLIKVVKK